MPLSLQSRLPQITEDLLGALNEPGEALAPAALAIARVEYPALDPAPYLQRLERMGEAASGRLRRQDAAGTAARIATLNTYLYEELGFSGNRDRYDDPRNSFLNEVLDRRLGIPISLAAIYMEIGRRAGLRLEGVNFPGHFLVRAPGERETGAEDAIIDPFHAGALLSEVDCRQLLRQHLGEEAAFDRALLATATRQHIVVRMLVNLKRLYVRMRSFPQARAIANLLLAVDPSALSELRDRGLLAYHMEDFASALRDLEAYLRLMPHGDGADPDPHAMQDESNEEERASSESAQIWEHVKTLRRRVAGFN
ncbi:MAG TPA: transglutaminase-like domain-containing protein [Vicinamibacterales bacterium]|nr:transglutaminase-like domain-containing protein [Vicinamibacterales bacterium]